MMEKKKRIVVLLLFFGLIFSLRFIHLGADPPKDLSISMGYYGDPGGYVFNARNKIVLGTWEVDTWNLRHISPLPNYMAYAVFWLLGPGIAQMNMIPAVFSCLLLLALFFLLKNTAGTRFAFLGVFLLGINYVFLMFSRIGIRAVEMVFFIVFGIYFLTAENIQKTPRLFLAGAMCFLAFTVKGTVVLILPAVLLGLACHAFFQNRKQLKPAVSGLMIFGLGMAAVFVIWLFLVFLPQRDLILSFGTGNYEWLAPRHHHEILKNIWERPFYYFGNMPVMTSMAGLWLLVLFFRVLTSPKKISVPEWISSFWFISNIMYFSIIYYRPARHFVPLIVPIVILAVFGLRGLFQIEKIRKAQNVPILFIPLLFVWLLLPVSGLIILHGRPPAAEWDSKFLLTVGICLGLAVLFFSVIRFWPRRWIFSIPRPAKILMVGSLVLGSVMFNANPYLKWASAPRFDMRDISRDFDKAFETMNLGGLIAPVISLENRHRAHPYYTDIVNRGLDFLEKYRITHLLTSTYAVEKTNLQRDFPEAMAKAKLLARFPLWKTSMELFELNPPLEDESPERIVHEGEIFFGENGIPRFDPRASGKYAYRIEKSRDGSLLQLPGFDLEPGEYRFRFFLKAEKNLLENSPVARLDAADFKRKRVIRSLFIQGGDFIQPDFYQDFSFDVSLNRKTPLFLRVFSAGNTELWFDKVVIERLGGIRPEAVPGR
jgi:4-amino-4-deoxy-L-arabinose transferase-like glycosyltransferase